MLYIGNSHARKSRLLLAAISYGLPAIFIVAPLLSFLVYSFFHVQGGQLFYDLTLTNYRRFFTDPIFIPVLIQTCFLCAGVSVFTVLLGYPVAFLLNNLRGRRKYVLLMMVLVPLLMSYIIKIYAIRSILGGNGFLNRFLMWSGIVSEPLKIFVFNLNAVLLTLTVLLIPFAVLPIFLSLERIPKSLLEASTDLGASDWQTFARITFPITLPGVLTALSFVFVLAIGDFLTPQMVGGLQGFTFGRIIYSQFGTAFNWPFGAALSVILVFVIIGVVALSNRFESRESRS